LNDTFNDVSFAKRRVFFFGNLVIEGMLTQSNCQILPGSHRESKPGKQCSLMPTITVRG